MAHHLNSSHCRRYGILVPYTWNSQKAIGLFTAEEEVSATARIVINHLNLLRNILEACKDIPALSTVFLSNLLYKICSHQGLDQHRLVFCLTLLFFSNQEVICQEGCNLVSCKENILVLGLCLWDCNAKSICIGVCSENDIGLDLFCQCNDLLHCFGAFRVWKLYCREGSVWSLLLLYNGDLHSKS